MVKCDNTHKAGAISFTFLILSMAIGTSVWIQHNGHKQLDDLKVNVNCVKCAKCQRNDFTQCKECENRDIVKSCRAHGWWLPSLSHISKKCAEDENFITNVQKHVSRKYHEHSVEKTVNRKQHEFLDRYDHAFSDPSRIIIQWFPHCWNRGETIGWTNLTGYERDPSTYTISTGPPGSCEKDTFIVIPERGLYRIDGRLSFACNRADNRTKRIHMEVAMIGNVKDELAIPLLRDEDENTCWLEGDLLTLYSSGLFRLDQDNKIFLRYKAPSGVKLSSQETSPFQSTFGVYKVGLS